MSGSRIDYDFEFPSGRLLSAEGQLSEPRTAVITMCTEVRATKEGDTTFIGVPCGDWAERRETVLSLLALGYSTIEQECFDDTCDDRILVRPADLGITPDQVTRWAEHWLEYIGRGPVYD